MALAKEEKLELKIKVKALSHPSSLGKPKYNRASLPLLSTRILSTQ